jgi:hypothetical protein
MGRKDKSQFPENCGAVAIANAGQHAICQRFWHYAHSTVRCASLYLPCYHVPTLAESQLPLAPTAPHGPDIQPRALRQPL